MKSETKHTPGPWIMKPPSPTNSGLDAFDIVTDQRLIASVYLQLSERGKDLMEETGKNARLIAAAPELLAVCKIAVEMIKPNVYPCPDKPNSLWGKLQKLQAVIAKIEGGEA